MHPAAFCEQLGELNAALVALYPLGQPLGRALSHLPSGSSASPQRHDALLSLLDAGIADIEAVVSSVKEKVVHTMHVQAEMDHYSSKVCCTARVMK